MKHLKTYEGFSKPKMVEKPEQIYFTNIKANDIFEAWKILEKHFNIPKVDSSLNIDSNLFLKSIKNFANFGCKDNLYKNSSALFGASPFI